MIPQRIEGATRYLGAPMNWNPADGSCDHLAIRDEPTEGGSNAMLSVWEPTPEELQKIMEGKPVYLQVLGVQHPPVYVWVP